MGRSGDRVPRTPRVERLTVTGLSHEGRGVARGPDGKAVFVDLALAGEVVEARWIRTHARFDEAVVTEVLEASPDRVVPRCPHFGGCGGCSLQHMAPAAQLVHKEAMLLEQIQHAASILPGESLPPLTGPLWGYRSKARLSVNFVPKKGGVLVGFRERASPLIADIARCEVLDPRVGEQLPALRAAVAGLACADKVPQIEVAASADTVALVFRHMAALTVADRAHLAAFGEAHGFTIYLQPAGHSSVAPLDPASVPYLTYTLPAEDIRIRFRPTDFIQINQEINRSMVGRALEYLAPQPGDRILDLFCGLGNFTLPLARRGAMVVGIEGEAALVSRADENAGANGLTANARFITADLAASVPALPWESSYPLSREKEPAADEQQIVPKLLLDPPRTGAEGAIRALSLRVFSRIVYISCDPATLARDTAILVKEQGYRLTAAGIMDMFPHTSHVESIAIFDRKQ